MVHGCPMTTMIRCLPSSKPGTTTECNQALIGGKLHPHQHQQTCGIHPSKSNLCTRFIRETSEECTVSMRSTDQQVGTLSDVYLPVPSRLPKESFELRPVCHSLMRRANGKSFM